MTLADRLREVVGPQRVFAGPTIEDRYRADVTRKYASNPALVVRPGSTEEVAEIVRIAAETGTPITPLGGNTGVVGGAACQEGGILLSLERMNRILEVDHSAMTMTVEAGVILQTAHEAAEAQDMLLPLDLGARGSATIGGNIATNAGGNRVLRWGNMRDMVLGLEAVMADGSVLTSLGKVLKDNAGYNWKHLLIGSEGTLGIVTKAVLRLRPLPRTAETALVALQGWDCAARLLRRLEGDFAGQLSSFEVMEDAFYRYTSGFRLDQRPRPLPDDYPLYAVVEAMGGNAERDPDYFREVLAAAMDDGLVLDAVIAQSERERADLWSVRDDLTEPFRPLFPLFAFDVSMALADMPRFVDNSRATLRADFPDAHIFYYGHAGDGNLHVVVSTGAGDAATEHAVDDAVYQAVASVGGSIAAEHGIGRAKRDFIGLTRTPEELALMRTLKRALDPGNILNPDVILPAE